MRLLIMCEGSNEKKIVDMLLKNGCLSFTEDDLLDLVPYHARQITKSAPVRMALNMYPGEVKILRIGDKQSDKLVIPKEYKDKIVSVEKYCTKPELEMLLIIACGLQDSFEKVKSTMPPMEFAQRNIKLGKKSYDNSTKFYEDFFEKNIELLVTAIKEYKRIRGKTHAKDEHCLSELLR